MSLNSPGGRFEPQIAVKAARATAAQALLSMYFIGQDAVTCTQIAGSITLLLLLSLVFPDRHARIPDSRHDPNLTGQFMPVGIMSRGQKTNSELRRQIAFSYSSDGIAASTVSTHGQLSMEGLRSHSGDTDSGFASGFASSDCRVRTPIGYTRIYIAYRADARSGTGTASDPFDDGTAQKFDTLLRTRSGKSVTKLVVCIESGTFQTEGVHDYLIGVGHLNKTQASGFTVNRGWRFTVREWTKPF
jgi:hypothetical protein